ncbi:MAG: hypothetical protein IEMM0008_1424 [bacterium]|nr:MAG: hypothetical protein IEMM0008_1424 [bacterium]
MPIANIALVGSTKFFKTTLFDILKESDFEVDRYDVDSINLKDKPLQGYDVVIISANLSKNVEEEELFSFLLSSKGFLLADANINKLGSFTDSTSYIDDCMSPEEILSRINTIIYKRTSARPARNTPRMTTNVDVEYEFEGQYYKSKILSISKNGAFIRSLNPLPEGSLIKLQISLPLRDKKIGAVGRVLYSIVCDLANGIITQKDSCEKKIIALPGMGISFEEISEVEIEAIMSYIDLNLF